MKNKKKLLHSLSCAVLVAGLGLGTASADTFSWTLSGATDSGTGTFVANETDPSGIYLINTMTGTIDGMTVSSLLPVNTYPGTVAPNNNLLYYPAHPTGNPSTAPASFIDIQGISFTLGPLSLGTAGYYNLYFGQDYFYDPYVYNLDFGPEGTTNDFLTSFNVVDLTPPPTPAVPEPSSLVLLGTGALGLAGVAKRRFRQNA